MSETCCRTSRLMLPDFEPPLTTVAPVSWFLQYTLPSFVHGSLLHEVTHFLLRR
jgi:hypothetical protein